MLLLSAGPIVILLFASRSDFSKSSLSFSVSRSAYACSKEASVGYFFAMIIVFTTEQRGIYASLRQHARTCRSCLHHRLFSFVPFVFANSAWNSPKRSRCGWMQDSLPVSK